MLVLSRQRNEVIMIGDDIEVVVIDIRGNKVRLGISAPRNISVHRKEARDAIRKENCQLPIGECQSKDANVAAVDVAAVLVPDISIGTRQLAAGNPTNGYVPRRPRSGKR